MNEPYNIVGGEDDDEEFVYKKQPYQKQKQSHSQLNFFQEDFSRPQKKEQLEQMQQENEKGQVLQEFSRRQAFMNFRKSDQTLTANNADGIQVKYHGDQPQQQQIVIEQPQSLQDIIKQIQKVQIKSAFKNKTDIKKSVSINLEQNEVFSFVKSQEEYLTYEEKRTLADRVMMHRNRMVNQSYDEDDEGGQDSQESDDVQDDPQGEYQDRRNYNAQDENDEEFGDEQEESDDQGEDEEDDEFIITKEILKDLKHRRAFLFGNQKKQDQQKDQDIEIEPKKKIKQNQQHSEQDFQKTYDKGYEMLKKMGYKAGAGLGKDEQGIQKPILAVMKKSLQGGSDPLIDLSQETDRGKQTKKDGKKLKKLEKQWKKNKKSHPKELTALKMHNEKQKQINLSRGAMVRKVELGDQVEDKLKIIDMTGANTTLYGSMQNYLVSKVNDDTLQEESNKQQAQKDPQQLNLIRQNLQDKVDKLYNKISKTEMNIKSEKDKIVMFKFEKTQKDEQIDQYVQEVTKRKIFLGYLEQLDVQHEENSQDIINMLDKFIVLFHNYKDDFIQFNVYTLCLKIIGDSIDKRLITWGGPQSSQSHDQLHHELKAVVMVTQLLKDVFLHKKALSIRKYSKNLGEAQKFILSNQKISSGDVRTLRRFTAYLVKNIIGKIRKFIVNEWVPEEEHDLYLLDFLQSWSKTIIIVETDDIDSVKHFVSAIAKEQEIEILEQLILPRLHQSIDRWTHKENSFMHSWLLPWYVYIKQSDEKQLVDLNKVIIAKLSQTFQHWKPQQAWGFHCIQPWKRFLEESKWDNLMLRAIVPKLMHSLMSEFKINPADQDISLIQVSIQWSEILSDEQVIIIFEQCIFLEIENVLVVWKDHGGDQYEITMWLKGWENILSKVIQRLPKFKGFFRSLHNKL